ncbi:MAG: conjugal transfer protein [Solirubrobacteraceae bacterium]
MRLVRRWRPRRREIAVRLTGGELFARLGRLVLWAAVAVVLVRGLGDILASPRSTPIVAARERTRDVWPDDAARAFAVQFATAYLHQSPQDDPGDYARRIADFGSSELASELAPRLDRRGSGQAARTAAVAGSTTVDARHALLTVAATVTTADAVTTRHLTVPVARDAAGGLTVYDLPSFAAAPTRASAAPPNGEPLVGDERPAVEDVVGRFLRVYLAGDSGGLSYLVPPGTRIAAVGGRFELVELGSITSFGEPSGDERLVLVRVRARDLFSRALYALRYRVRLVRRDRWYAADVNGAGAGSGSR